MSWEQVARPHIGHRMSLSATHSLKCHDCTVTLFIHKEANAARPTPVPPAWTPPERGTPMPSWFRERVTAEALARRRQQPPTEESA